MAYFGPCRRQNPGISAFRFQRVDGLGLFRDRQRVGPIALGEVRRLQERQRDIQLRWVRALIQKHYGGDRATFLASMGGMFGLNGQQAAVRPTSPLIS